MRAATKLVAFTAGLGLAFGAAAAVGAAVGPISVTSGSDDHGDGHGTDTETSMSTATAAGAGLSGLAVAADGYRLVTDAASVDADTPTSFTFHIEGPDGEAVTAFDELHERRLHLIVVSRNLVDYAHLHPELDDGGEWTVEMPALSSGSYRVYADFQPTGAEQLTLAADLSVPGAVDAGSAPVPASVFTVDDYDVALSGDIAPTDVEVAFDVSLDGDDVTTDPYLGAAGHLVVIRAGDLGYLHVHPLESDGSQTIRFMVDFPTAGTYRLFLDFSHDGEVRTAAFTVDVPSAGNQPMPDMSMPEQSTTTSEHGSH